jgi:hypothetical protein
VGGPDDTAWLDEPAGEEFDWLDGEGDEHPAPDLTTPPAEPLADHQRSELARLFGGKLTLEKDPRYANLAVRVARLPLRKRQFLRFLATSQFHTARAIKQMSAAYGKADPSTIYRWMRDDKQYQDIVAQYADLVLEASGIKNPVSTLMRIDGVIEDALSPVPKINNGVPVFYAGNPIMEVDRDNALKGLKMIGEYQKLFRSDEEVTGRVTVTLDFSGEVPAKPADDQVLEGEFTPVSE